MYVDIDLEKGTCGLYKGRLIRRGMNIEEQNTMHNQANKLLMIHHQTPPSRDSMQHVNRSHRDLHTCTCT